MTTKDTNSSNSRDWLAEFEESNKKSAALLREAGRHVNYLRSLVRDISVYLPKDHPWKPGINEVINALEAEHPPRDWLIRNCGYFYRPNRAGYTAQVSEAGRYTEAEAKKEAEIAPTLISAHHESEFEPATARASAPHTDEHLARFSTWLATQMPAGTVIGDPNWWAKRILAAACVTAPEWAEQPDDTQGAESKLVIGAVNGNRVEVHVQKPGTPRRTVTAVVFSEHLAKAIDDLQHEDESQATGEAVRSASVAANPEATDQIPLDGHVNAMCGWAELLAEKAGWTRENARSFWASYDLARSAVEHSTLSKAQLKASQVVWVSCPICAEPDMRCEIDSEGNRLVYCVNHARASNKAPELDAPSEQSAAHTDQNWFRVEVLDHEGTILAIEPQMLVGREIGPDETAKLREAMEQLRGFVGSQAPTAFLIDDEPTSLRTDLDSSGI